MNTSYRVLMMFSIFITSLVVNAESKIYSFKEGINAEVQSVSDCIPILTGKVSLGGNGSYAYNYECRNATETGQYNTAYQSKFNFVFDSKEESESFFNEYLKNKMVMYLQDPEIKNVKYYIREVIFKSKESSCADYIITYNWNGQLLLKQGRFLFKNGYIADWSVKSEASSGKAAEEFDKYVKYFNVIL